MAAFGETLLKACARVVRTRPWLVLVLALLVTAAAGVAATRLTVNTSTEDILSAELPFRQVDRRYRQAFPREELAIVVVDAPTGAQARNAAADLAGRLRARSALFERVEVPGASPYFERNALLFLSVDQLRTLSGQIGEAQPVLTLLAGDPSLRGLAQLVGFLQGAAGGGAPDAITGLVSRLADVTQARAAGEEAQVAWDQVFGLDAEREAGTRQLVLAKPVLDNASLDRAEPALSALRAEIDALRPAWPDVTMRVTGEPALRQQELNDSFSGALYASGLSFVLVALSLVLGIRSGRLIAALLITLVIGSIWTTGLAALTVGRLNLISVAFMVLFFGLGVDFGTHLGLRHLEEVGRGTPFPEAITRAIVGEGPGIALSALCAAIGFLSFVPTTYVGLAEFGVISAWGMLVAVVVTFTVLPALMAIMPPRRPEGLGVSIGLGGWIRRRAWAILILTLLASSAAAFVVPRARLDVNTLNLQNQEAEPVRTFRDLAEDPETSPYALNALAPTLEAAQNLAVLLEAAPGAAETRTVASFIPTNQAPKLAIIAEAAQRLAPALTLAAGPPPTLDDAALSSAFTSLRQAAASLASAASADTPLAAAAQRLTDALGAFAERRGTEPAALRELDAALTGGLALFLSDLRTRLSVTEPVSINDLSADLRRDWVSPEGVYRVQVLPADDLGDAQALERFARGVQAIAPQANGTPVIVTEAGEAILEAFAQAIAYTAVAIAVVILLLRRRISDVVLVLAPLAVASLWTVAASALLDLPFNFANVIVIPLLIGLGVASSVHIVVRAREGEGHAGEPEADVLDTSTPLAVLVAQLNTVGAFATLAISAHRGLYSMGLLLGVAILFVLISSLVALPALMVLLQRRRDRGPALEGGGEG